MGLDDYIKAGKIAGEVRENVRKTDWVGKTVYEICEYVEGESIDYFICLINCWICFK